MNNDVFSEKIPIIIIIVIIICLFLNHSIKKKAFDNAVDEKLIRSLMACTYEDTKDNEIGYVICTDDNITDISNIDNHIHLGIIDKSVTSIFDITIESNGKRIETKGYLGIKYDKNAKTKWEVTSRSLGDKMTVYE